MSELRLVLTNSCNFRCFFCHSEGSKDKADNKLDEGDYTYLFLQSKKILNTDNISITGGEPTCRKDIVSVVKNLYKAGAKITMTSNFSIITQHMEMGKYINKMNISFHTFDNGKLNEIIDVHYNVNDLMDNVKKYAHEYPNVKLCLNCTVTKKNCDKENLINIIEFANETNADVNFSELYSEDENEIVRMDKFEGELIQEGFNLQEFVYGRSRVYVRNRQKVKLSKILCVVAKNSDNPRKYCNEHRDLFITPDGKIDICREKNLSVDILKAIKDRNDVCVIDSLKEARYLLGYGCKEL